MEVPVINAIAQVFAAIGTVAVAILAIWGDKIRAAIAGPKLQLQLRDTRGNLTTRADQKKTIYYHVKVTNKRTWSPARYVRVLVTGLEKKRPDGTYFPESLVAPLQLTWAYPQFHELLPTITTNDICDLGFLGEDAQRFNLSTYVIPNNFRGYAAPGESLRVQIIASAHNFESKSPLILEISWDGAWSSDMDEMQRHLVIKEVPQDQA
jgi:hypothetical protein